MLTEKNKVGLIMKPNYARLPALACLINDISKYMFMHIKKIQLHMQVNTLFLLHLLMLLSDYV